MKKIILFLVLLTLPFTQIYSQKDKSNVSVSVTMKPIYKLNISGSDGVLDFSFKGDEVYYSKEEFIITIGASHHYTLDLLIQDCYLIDEKGEQYNLLNYLYYFFYRVESSSDIYNVDWIGDNDYTYFKKENDNVIKSISIDALGKNNIFEIGLFIDQKFKKYLISNDINGGKIYFDIIFQKDFQFL